MPAPPLAGAIEAPPPAAASLASDSKQFDADFSIKKELGRGRFGEVCLAERRADKTLYALKKTAFGVTGQPDQEKVEVEARALEQFMHPNIVHPNIACGPKTANRNPPRNPRAACKRIK
jgi:serine/threonine protein kinase